MPAAPLPERLVDFMRAPRPAVMATVRPDGSPVTTPCWYMWRDGEVDLSMDRSARRLGHLRANPAVSLTVLGDSWYEQVTVLGRAIEIRDDPDLVDLDRLAVHYTGEPYPERGPCVTVVMTVERYHSYGDPH